MPQKKGLAAFYIPMREAVKSGDNKFVLARRKNIANNFTYVTIHAVEGYITKGAWELTDMLHLKAIEIIGRSLRSAVAGTFFILPP